MAAEVMEMKFAFHSPREWDGILDLDQPLEKIREELITRLPFCFNAIHDIESAWWVGIWMLFHHMPKGHTELSQISSEHQRQTDRVFSGNITFNLNSLIHYLPDTGIPEIH